MDDETLVSILRQRAIGGRGIRDLLDLAEALLDGDAIQACLARLERPALAALWNADAPVPETDAARKADAATTVDLRGLLLTDEAGTALPEVREQLSRWPALGLPDPRLLAEPAPASEPAGAPSGAPDAGQVDRLATEHALAAVTATTQLLFELEREPARLLASGGIGLPETKRLAAAITVADERVPTFLGIAERAGLLDRHPTRLAAAAGHHDWLRTGVAARWVALASAWADDLPDEIRNQLVARRDTLWGGGLRRWLAWLYPAGDSWLRERVEDGLAEAELLGVTAGEALGSAGTAILAGEAARAAQLLAGGLPAPVDRVYLQHDLSIVAPGPLDADLDLRLRGMADAEGQALASSYRISTGSIHRALERGETAETILEFLAAVSLGPLPQPLRYLVGEAAARHGSLRVGGARPATADAAARIRSDDPALLETILVDSALAALALTATSGDEVVSPREPEVAYWTLLDARYPVALEGADGRVLSPRRRAAAGPPPVTMTDPVVDLVERLRPADTDPADLGAAWLTRQLAAAIRTKSTVTVSVRMPNGTLVDYRLEPASVAGGRLRARDPLSEIERTLPLASIAGVTHS